MKAATLSRFSNGIDDIEVVELPVPAPGPGEVRVRMRFSPINPSDMNFVRGTYHAALQRVVWNHGKAAAGATPSYDPGGRMPCPVPPYALGGEGMGVVDAVGAGLDATQWVGKRVAIASGPPKGTWQEFLTVPAPRVLPLPDNISDEQGAMFFVNPLAAYAMVRKVLRVKKGEWLLLTAAGSALGRSVVRMGRRYGFRTLCVIRSSTGKARLLADGADAVVATDTEDLQAEVARITGGAGVPYAIDCIGGELAAQVITCLGIGGELLLYGTLADQPVNLAVRDLMMPGARVGGFFLTNWLMRQPPEKVGELLREVATLTARGIFAAEVADTFPLADVRHAIRAANQPGRTGKVLLRMAG